MKKFLFNLHRISIEMQKWNLALVKVEPRLKMYLRLIALHLVLLFAQLNSFFSISAV